MCGEGDCETPGGRSAESDSLAGGREGSAKPSDPRAVAQDVVDDRSLTSEAWSRAVPEDVVDER